MAPCKIPAGLSPSCTQFDDVPLCWLSFLPVSFSPLPSVPGVFPQINYLQASLHLRLCFQQAGRLPKTEGNGKNAVPCGSPPCSLLKGTYNNNSHLRVISYVPSTTLKKPYISSVIELKSVKLSQPFKNNNVDLISFCFSS